MSMRQFRNTAVGLTLCATELVGCASTEVPSPPPAEIIHHVEIPNSVPQAALDTLGSVVKIVVDSPKGKGEEFTGIKVSDNTVATVGHGLVEAAGISSSTPQGINLECDRSRVTSVGDSGTEGAQSASPIVRAVGRFKSGDFTIPDEGIVQVRPNANFAALPVAKLYETNEPIAKSVPDYVHPGDVLYVSAYGDSTDGRHRNPNPAFNQNNNALTAPTLYAEVVVSTNEDTMVVVDGLRSYARGNADSTVTNGGSGGPSVTADGHVVALHSLSYTEQRITEGTLESIGIKIAGVTDPSHEFVASRLQRVSRQSVVEQLPSLQTAPPCVR